MRVCLRRADAGGVNDNEERRELPFDDASDAAVETEEARDEAPLRDPAGLERRREAVQPFHLTLWLETQRRIFLVEQEEGTA